MAALYDPARPRPVRHGLNLIWTLTWLNFTPRNNRESLKLVWVFLEPIGQMAVLMLIFTFIGRTASYGQSFALFLLTGVAILTLFTRGAELVKGAVVGLRSPNRLATVGPFHEALARILFKTIVAVIYTVVLAWGVHVWDNADVGPYHPLSAAAAMALTAVMAFGVGLLRGYAMRFLPAVERVYAILSRGLLFVSAIFYAPSFLPPQLREWLSWNPVLHAVELMRLGIYAEYPTVVFAPNYLIGFALGTVALGVAAIWRRRGALMD